MNVVLIGMKHCGKSTIGKLLAARWECPFYDIDPMIEETHACDTGDQLSVREIFEQHGETYFRRIEGHVVCELYLKLDRPERPSQKGDKHPTAHDETKRKAQSTEASPPFRVASVVALGGRTALNSAICTLLRAIGPVVYMQVTPDVIFERIEQSGIPPFLSTDDPSGDFFTLCRQRHPQYRDLADFTVDINGLDPGKAVDVLEVRIKEECTRSNRS